MTELEYFKGDKLALTIWNKKYRQNKESFESWVDRVSNGIVPIKKLIKQKKFVFGGRILASRGIIDRKVTYSNCYVLSPPEDNLESIFQCSSNLARTFSYGGGCGIDVSKLAPKGAKINNAAKTTSGSTSFMDLFSYITGLIGQEGRRGALMISIDCTHPDLVDFINLKADTNICTKANISVKVSDEFMDAVINDKDWELSFTRSESTEQIHKVVKAKEIFMLLAKRNWEMAEPGILYWDKIKNYNMLNNIDFDYAGVNPCAEEPLPAGGSCLLGSINLSEFVKNPFTSQAYVDYENLKEAVAYSIIALNQVLLEGMSLHPLQEQRDSVYNWRQIGLGTMGLGDMLIKLGITYGSEKALNLIDAIFKDIAIIAVKTSLELAKNVDCYPMCNKEKLVESSFITNLNLDSTTLQDIRKYGLFNSQLLTCAPTGSIGTMLNISTGVEPNYAFFFTRKTETLNGEDTYYKVDAGIVALFKEITGENTLPDYFVSSSDIAIIDRIKTQGTIQKYIDASISSTINLPENATIKDVFDIYINAWKYGLKGITIYRDNCQRQGILTKDKPKTIEGRQAPKRPKELEAATYLIKAKGEQFIILVGMLEDKPYEIFAFRPRNPISFKPHKGIITKVSKMHYSFTSDIFHIDNLELANENVEESAATLYSSMLLRHGVDIKYIIKTAKKVNDNITSFSSAMCRVLSKYIPNEKVKSEVCPDCGGTLIRENGCVHCSSCGWSKCN